MMLMTTNVNPTTYPDYSVDRKEGLFIYTLAYGSIPQEVYFIPCKVDIDTDPEEKLLTVIEDGDAIAYITYFQGMRWGQSDLSNVILSLKYKEILFGTNEVKIRLSYGAITFDKRFNHLEQDNPVLESDDEIISVPLILKGKKVFLDHRELPDAIGFPTLFESIDENFK